MLNSSEDTLLPSLASLTFWSPHRCPSEVPKRHASQAGTPTAGSAAKPATWVKVWPSLAEPTRLCVSPAWTVSIGWQVGAGERNDREELGAGPRLGRSMPRRGLTSTLCILAGSPAHHSMGTRVDRKVPKAG